MRAGHSGAVMAPAPFGAAAGGFTASRIGRAARVALADPGPGHVLAVFQRSFYIESAAGRLACLGPAAMGAGPLNGLLDLPDGWSWQAGGLRPGDPFHATDGVAHVGHRFTVSFTAARDWRPKPFPAAARGELARGLAALTREARARAPEEGLGRLIAGLPRRDGLVLARARRADAAFVDWLSAGAPASGAAGPPGFIEALVGLGPGLTPSGDDYLGGAMIALSGLGEADAVRRLAGWALDAAADRSTKISLAHLACAAEGEGATALHDTLAAICAPDTADLASVIDAAIGEIDRIGHSSGWDALAGAAAVLAWRLRRS